MRAATRTANTGLFLAPALLAAAAFAACDPDATFEPDADGEAHTDVGGDADADADADPETAVEAEADADGAADAEADAEADADVDPDLLPPLDGPTADALATVSRLVVVVTPSWRDPGARLALFARDGAGWAPVLGPWPAEVGRTGLSWGRGLTQPPPAATNVKAEGDGSAPAGIFRLGPVMGYDADPPAGLALPYRRSTAHTICVDDPVSSHYNKLLETTEVVRDWSSWENMLRTDELYRLLAPIDHNGLLDGGTPVPGGGSCIFLHLWSGAGVPTIGCTALDGGELLELLLALERLDDVLLVQLPQVEYDAAVALWGLPALPE